MAHDCHHWYDPHDHDCSPSPSLSLASFASLSSLSVDGDSSTEQHSHEEDQSNEEHDDAGDRLGSSSDGDAADDEQQETLRSPRHRRRRSLHVTSRSPSPPSRGSIDIATELLSPEAKAVSPQRRISTQEHTEHQTRQRHFHALFVRVDPPLLRGLRHLELSAQNLKRSDLLTLTANLFLLEVLKSISLADNQLEDSCVKELRSILSLDGLERADFSRNLLGRGTAKMVADRLAHRLALRSLDVSGNPRFFAFDDAHEIARTLAQGLAANLAIVDFRISLPVPQPHLERDRLILPQAPPQQPQQQTSQRRKERSFGSPGRARRSCTDRDREASPAETFTRELGELLQAGGALQSLGLVYAELSRRTIVNLMKLANRLVVLDLSFAFAGIAAAQVVATALKMKDNYAALTQLNLRGNRLKAMGARALCKALHANARLTDLNLSRNELRSELLLELSAMLRANHTLVRLDLTQNDELFYEISESSTMWQALVASLEGHSALRSLGTLERLSVATSKQRQTLLRVLERHQQRSDNRVLVGVHESMAFEANDNNNLLGGAVVTTTVSTQQHHQREKTIWKQQREIVKQARVSVKWKMRAFVPAVATHTSTNKEKGRTVASSPVQHSIAPRRIGWRVVVHRKCDVAGAVEYEAAQGALAVSLSPSTGGFELCSALVYCDARDALSIVVSLCHNDHDDDDSDHNCYNASFRGLDTVKVLAKEFVVLPHPLSVRHVSFHYDASEASPLAVPRIEWLPKRVRNPATDLYAYTAEMFTQVYVARTARYRLVWRVRIDAMQLGTSTGPEQQLRLLDLELLWRVQRSHCWAPDADAVVVLEGSCRALQAVVRNERELVVCSPPLEFVAGELVHLRAETNTKEVALRLLQWFVLDETAAWENAPPVGKPSPPH